MHPGHQTLLDDLAPVVGYTATCALAAWYEGKNLYVPSAYAPDHQLARLIGEPALRALVGAFASETLAIPPASDPARYRRDRLLCECVADGLPLRRIAEIFDLSVRRVEQLREDLEARGWIAYADGRVVRAVGPVGNPGQGGAQNPAPSHAG